MTKPPLLRHPLRIGLTGGIGCGKTTVCDLFATLDITIIDADIIAREIVQPDKMAHQEIIATFGSGILTENNVIDRKKLRNIVFDQPKKLQQLEKITHPRIMSSMLAQANQATSPYCILCIPLLFEKNLRENVDRVLVIDLPVDVQKQRVASRDKINLTQVEAIMSHQLRRKQRLALANDIIKNDSSVAALDSQVQELHKQYLTLANSL